MLKVTFISFAQWIVGSSPTMTMLSNSVKEGKEGSYYGWWLGSSWNNGGLPKARSLYGMTINAVCGANQSQTHQFHRTQPVFGRSSKEGKQDSFMEGGW